MKTALSSNFKGYLLFVLNAHLPYIRYPEHEYHLEENWLYEAVTETYIPLLNIFNNFLNDNVDFRITISLTPTLIEMLNDGLLRERYERYISNLIELSEKEIARTRRNMRFNDIARMYNRNFLKIKHLFEDTYKKDLISAFGALQDTGKVEIITSAATHGYLPALMTEPVTAMAQISLASEHYKTTFGKKPNGIWLPECGFVPGIDALLKKAGLKFFFLESHGVLGSIPESRYSIYAPVKTPSGVIAFARDVESSKQVWSSVEGYPGDFDYRDFYRDIGFDLDYVYIKPYLPSGIRTFTGIKYFRITGTSGDKKPYIIKKAVKKSHLHARHFISSRTHQILSLSEELKRKPVIIASYDAELFGHWWFEGTEWLNRLIRNCAAKQKTFKLVTPSEYIAKNPDLETVRPSMSSWGNKGYSSTWIDTSNSWIYKHLHRAAKLMTKLADKNFNATGLKKRALNQAARELLLSQASDWAFMMKNENAHDFAKNKFTEHIMNFQILHREITSNRINKNALSVLENKNCIFPALDYRIFTKN